MATTEAQYLARMQERAATTRPVRLVDLRVGDELISGHVVTAIVGGDVTAVGPVSGRTLRLRGPADDDTRTFMVVAR